MRPSGSPTSSRHARVAERSALLDAPRRFHVVGIGGAGMSAIALVLAQMGHRVSGSDLRASATLDRLELAGVRTFVGHDAEHVASGTDAVVVSTAVPAGNPEVVRAAELGIPVLRRAEILAAIVASKPSIAVAGSHGKTTTSSMLTLVLRAAGWHPSFVIGGELNEVGTNASWDRGSWLVVEADESDGTFLELPAVAAIVTSVEPDHLEHYGDFAALARAFEAFVGAVPEVVALGADDPRAAALAGRARRSCTYGFAEAAQYRIADYRAARVGSVFTLLRGGDALGELALPVPGRHNAANAAGAVALALELGAPFSAAATALAAFGGVARRFQFRGERGGVTFVDDYAHLPAEVRAAIAAARDGGWRRLVVVFQPHRYSRTVALGRDFATAFDGADHVVITDVYPAGEVPRPGVSGRIVHDAVTAARPDLTVEYVPTLAGLADLPERLAGPGDLVLTLGAGDLTTVPDLWLEQGR
jgi:UDP-N-acetylmuramate--alanine ligase